LLLDGTLIDVFDLYGSSLTAIIHDRVNVAWDAALREELRDLDPDPLFWLDAYCAAHAAKHGSPLRVEAKASTNSTNTPRAP